MQVTETIISDNEGLLLIIRRYARGRSIIYDAISKDEREVVVYCKPTVNVKNSPKRNIPIIIPAFNILKFIFNSFLL